MTALEEQLRDEMRRIGMAPIPAGRDPDPWVFGVMYVRGEPRGGGWGYVGCPVHQVGWEGPGGCWCCAAGVKPC